MNIGSHAKAEFYTKLDINLDKKEGKPTHFSNLFCSL